MSRTALEREDKKARVLAQACRKHYEDELREELNKFLENAFDGELWLLSDIMTRWNMEGGGQDCNALFIAFIQNLSPDLELSEPGVAS